MSEEYKVIMSAIMNQYGFHKQMEQFTEECAEAILSVQKLKRYRDDYQLFGPALENFKEEVADVLVMAEQMRLFLGAEEIDEIKSAKVQRQFERIKKEKGIGGQNAE